VPGPKTNEREGTRAVLRNSRTSPYKIREVLDLVRGLPVGEARDILRFSERDAAALVLKLLDSAVANAENNDHLVPDELYVAACFADEGRTYKTFRPRARGRAGRIRKRTAHVTIIVSRLPEARLGVVKARQERAEVDRRSRRVAASQKQGGRSRRTRRGRAEPAAATEHEDIVDPEAAALDQVEQDDTNGSPAVEDITDIAAEPVAEPSAMHAETGAADQPAEPDRSGGTAQPAEDEEK